MGDRMILRGNQDILTNTSRLRMPNVREQLQSKIVEDTISEFA